MRRKSGFTLAELLIALGILGVIATFTIPKILYSGSSGKMTAIAKEVASMISGAWSTYSLTNGTLSSSLTPGVITQYLNYVSTTTAGAGYDADTCAAGTPCYILHNGAYLQFHTGQNFGGVSTSYTVWYNVDPDGNGTAASPVTFLQFYGGRLSTMGAVGSANQTTGGTSPTSITTDPSYIQNWQ